MGSLQRDLATHYRVAKVDTVLKTFVGEVNDYWGNDTSMIQLNYDAYGRKNGLIRVKGSNGTTKLTGLYAGGNKSGIWKINQGKTLLVDFGEKKAKSVTVDSLEMCLARKEAFKVGQYIRKSDYPEIYTLISKSLSNHINKEGVFTVVEESAYFPNGMQALGRFISAYIKYPEEAVKNNIKGQVIVEFTITTDGSTTDFKVLRGLGYGCDEEAIRVLKLLPDWVPAYQHGKAVKTKFRLPITFG